MLNFKSYLANSRALANSLNTLKEEQAKQDNVVNWVVFQDEDGEESIVEKFCIGLQESEGSASVDKESTPSKANMTGVLHELLVGKHLNGGTHMEKHKNIEGDSPKQAHDKYKALLDKHFPGEYEKTAKRAESAAKDIRSKLNAQGHVIKHVHWTSKAGDIGRSTGGKFNLSQTQDASDIIIHSHHKDDPKKTIKYTGVSLKKSDTNSHSVPASNMGIEHSGPEAQSDLEAHRKELHAEHPFLAAASSNPRDSNGNRISVKKARANWLHNQPKEVKDQIKAKNVALLQKTASKLANHLNSLPKDKLAEHVRKVLAAKNSPMHGVPIHPESNETHESIKHITYGANEPKHETVGDVEKHYSHITSSPEHITAVAKGGSVHFYHKGEKVAEQSMKFSSQSDPLSAMVSSGREYNSSAKKVAGTKPSIPAETKPAKVAKPAKVDKPKKVDPTAGVPSRRLQAEQVQLILNLIKERQ